MRNFSKNEYSFVKTLFQTSQEELRKWLGTHMESLYNKDRVITTADYVYAIGDIPVCLVAHMDTVHKVIPYTMFYDRDQSIMWSPQGIGADDRAGIYGILYLLWKGLRPHVLFTTDEEIGGLGAQAAAKELMPEINFVIQLDRRGTNDSVFYDCDNPEFEKFVNGYGFETATGSFSDISYLCPDWKVAGVNFSIGYEREHTASETLNVNDMFETIGKVEKILNTDLTDKKFQYIESKTAGYGYSSYLYGSWDKYFDEEFKPRNKANRKDVAYSYPVDIERQDVCHECFQIFDKNIMIDLEAGVYCGDCYSKLFTTCTHCQDVFKDPTKTHLLCERCRGDEKDNDIEV